MIRARGFERARSESAAMHPSGTVTLLFTDIVGSTQRWERYGAAMGEAVRTHDAMMRSAIEARGGYIFKTVGDMFCAAFDRVEAGIASALDAQQLLAEERFGGVGGLHVRMALHAGTCEERDGDYFGPAVNRAARLLAIAHGGQILLSGAAQELAQDVLPAGCVLIDHGPHRLKDLSHPEHVFGLLAPGLRAEFPPLRSLSTMANNLPRFLTPIIGREREVHEITQCLGESPIVSIVGPGGIGKTRTAVQVAANAVDGTGDGVWFVDLAPLSDPSLIAATVANAIGLDLPAGRDPVAVLALLLRQAKMLIVLDNCEHLVVQAAVVAERLVRECPHLRVLATTREPLAIPGESVYRLDTLDDASAIALFVSRAQHADRHFAATGADVGIVGDICRRLDGIALAIELAAARVHALPLPQLAGRLDERFSLLAGGNRTALPRQQTMRALIDWSYDLLSPDEAAVFRRLGVFAGGFTLEAATAVAGDAVAHAWNVADRLSALVDKSMVFLDAGSQRYRLYESIRDYALNQLGARDEERAARDAHARYYAGVAERSAATIGIKGESEEQWMARYEPELDNLRAALDWSVATNAELAARMAADLTDFWFQMGMTAEGLARTETIRAKLGDRGEKVEHVMWLSIAHNAIADGQYARALEAAVRAEELCARSGDRLALAHARIARGRARYFAGIDVERVPEDLHGSIEILHELGRPLHATRAFADFGNAVSFQDPKRGRDIFAQALETAQSSGWLRESLRIQNNLADLDFRLGDAAAAIDRAKALVEAHRMRRAPLLLSMTLANLASYYAHGGRYEEAEAAAREALEMGITYENEHRIALALQSLAAVEAARGAHAKAALLLGFADAHWERMNVTREPVETMLRAHVDALLRAGMDAESMREHVARGHGLTAEAACRLAL